ncbi:hypothetical protein PVAND_017212 [Polypedilum vanderplanki]|uniref:Thioredoxin domain-containing protein n=1 Tax=Polypedilum vanderplanki TaxID=319348 RepID=A0A9J6BHL3_POLVA|nr:hypothetical protein PVAND_017212 [Polypedilum vanderplanki]
MKKFIKFLIFIVAVKVIKVSSTSSFANTTFSKLLSTVSTITTPSVNLSECLAKNDIYDANNNYISSYCFITQEMNNSDAKNYCQSYGMMLFTIKTNDEFNALQNFCSTNLITQGWNIWISGMNGPNYVDSNDGTSPIDKNLLQIRLANFGRCLAFGNFLKEEEFSVLTNDCQKENSMFFFTGDFMDIKKREKIEKANVGNETSKYLDYITYLDTHQCNLHEVYEQDRRDRRAKCIRAKGNGTLYLMNSLNEVMTLLTPISGNLRNDQLPGNCAVILFYTKFCAGCQALIPHYNALARNFPDIKVAALDALEHPGLNTDFGIIGLPTIVLFHNGRMLHKFNISQPATVTNFINFISSHTNLKPNTSNVVVTSEDFSPTSPLKVTMLEERVDIFLWISWIFIIVCAVYYFTKSRTYGQIVEMINRTWRESNEAQMQ